MGMEDAVAAEEVEDVGEREEKEKQNPSVLFLKAAVCLFDESCDCSRCISLVECNNSKLLGMRASPRRRRKRRQTSRLTDGHTYKMARRTDRQAVSQTDRVIILTPGVRAARHSEQTTRWNAGGCSAAVAGGDTHRI